MQYSGTLPKKYCVGVAVCAASYSFDRLFSYLSLQPIAPGCRVIVPFGKGNAKPVFADKNIRIRDKRIVGKNRNVVKLTIQDMAGGTYPAVYFGDAETMMQFLETKDVISIVYYPEINSYMGREEIQFVISNYC